MHVGSLTAREFTGHDIDLLQLAADRAAAALQSLTARDDRVAAAALQRSLLPSALPLIPGAQAAARYVPGQGVVGGDWYDVFALPSGEFGVVIGDVAGSGLPAAVVMGRMRSALRAYALETVDPGEVLDRLDRKMHHFEPGAMATVAPVVFDPGLGRAHIASAGHLPPVRRRRRAGRGAGRGREAGDDRRRCGAPAGDHDEDSPGTLLCFYTDGLVERREFPLDEGLARLCREVTAEPPDAACASVMGAMVGARPLATTSRC